MRYIFFYFIFTSYFTTSGVINMVDGVGVDELAKVRWFEVAEKKKKDYVLVMEVNSKEQKEIRFWC